jgi:BlaI family penicillinase repressor
VEERKEISTAEWQVMNVVWDQQPVTASEIIASLRGEFDWTAATIRTFLHRLVKKGALIYREDGNRYVYRSAISQSATIKKAGKSFLRSVFGGESAPLIAHFVNSSKLSTAEIDELRKLLEQKEKK